MAGTPSRSTPRLIKDYGQPRKFLRDMRARAANNSRPKGRESARSR
jgi:hypothetical protein